MRWSIPVCAGLWVGGWLATTLGASLARAELFYFAKGGEAQLPGTLSGETVRLEMPDGVIEFRKSDFRKIVPGYWPERDWTTRRDKALEGGPGACYEAIWWALENGLTSQAVSLLREAPRDRPAHPALSRMLAALERLERPCEDPDLTALTQILGQKVLISRGPHVVLVHQHSERDAAERITLLERVVTTYYLLFASQGLELPVPSRRMASAWFAEHEAYLKFLQDRHLDVFKTTRGYYHPTLAAVFAYDARSGGRLKSARDAIAARRLELERMQESIDTLPPRARLRFEVRNEPIRLLNRPEARTLLDELRRDVLRRELLLELERRSIDLGTAAHEMVHQLVAASGLAPRHDDFPHWLHEGFAAQFEVIRGGRWAGVGRAHDLRLRDWRSIQPSPKLGPLIHDIGFGQGYRRDLYAQAWSLAYYLRKTHSREFLTFIDILRTPNSLPTGTRERAAAAFTAAFGDDLDVLEREWLNYLLTVKSPIEQELPSAPSTSARGEIGSQGVSHGSFF